MKKYMYLLVVIFVIFFSIILIVYNKKTDLNALAMDLSNLTTNTLRISEIDQILESELNINMKDIEIIEDKDLKEYSLNSSLLSNYIIRENNKSKEKYIILLPKIGKKIEIQNLMSKYFEKNNSYLVGNRLEKEIDNFLIYLITYRNEEVYEKIVNKQKKIFSELFEESKESLEIKLKITKKDIKNFLVLTPYASLDSNLLIILKPSLGKINQIKGIIDEYLNEYQEQWNDYDDYQSDIIKNRLETEYNGYLIYIASSDNEKVLEVIKEHLK